MEKFSEEHEPTIRIDNNGIGPYEYAGAKGYDYGKNAADVEDSGPYTFGLDLSGYTEDQREDFLSGFDGEYYGAFTREYKERDMLGYFRRGGDIYVNLRFLVIVGETTGDIVTLTGEWVEKK